MIWCHNPPAALPNHALPSRLIHNAARLLPRIGTRQYICPGPRLDKAQRSCDCLLLGRVKVCADHAPRFQVMLCEPFHVSPVETFPSRGILFFVLFPFPFRSVHPSVSFSRGSSYPRPFFPGDPLPFPPGPFVPCLRLKADGAAANRALKPKSEGLISTDRGTKTTLLRTIPRSI